MNPAAPHSARAMNLRQRGTGGIHGQGEDGEEDAVAFDMPGTPVRAAAPPASCAPRSRWLPRLPPRSAIAPLHKVFRHWPASATASAKSWASTAPRFAPASRAGGAASSSSAAASCGSTSRKWFGPDPPALVPAGGRDAPFTRHLLSARQPCAPAVVVAQGRPDPAGRLRHPPLGWPPVRHRAVYAAQGVPHSLRHQGGPRRVAGGPARAQAARHQNRHETPAPLTRGAHREEGAPLSPAPRAPLLCTLTHAPFPLHRSGSRWSRPRPSARRRAIPTRRTSWARLPATLARSGLGRAWPQGGSDARVAGRRMRGICLPFCRDSDWVERHI